MKTSPFGIIDIRSSIFWKSYLLNILLILSTLAICWQSARVILPSVAQEKSKMVTDATVDRLAKQASVIIEEFRNLEGLIRTNGVLLSSNDTTSLITELEKLVKYSALIDSAAIINNQGDVISRFPHSGDDMENVSFRSYFSNSLQTRNAYLSDVILTKSGQPALILAIPLLNSKQEVKNIVALRIEIMKNPVIQSLFEHFDIGEHGYPFVVDENGRLLFHPKKERIGEDVHGNAVVKQLIKGSSGYQRLTDLQGVEMLASYRYIPVLKWGVVAQVPVESTYFPLLALKQTVERNILLFLVPMMFLVALYTQRSIQPVKRLQKAVYEVAKGNYDYHIATDGKSETGILFQLFNDMVGNIRENRHRLRVKQLELGNQKLFLSQILDLEPNYIYARDREGKYTLVNQAKLHLYGFSNTEDMMGKKEIELNPDQLDAKICLEHDQKVFKEEKAFFIPEHTFVDKQGKTHWILVHKIPLKNSANQVEQVLSIATDITERKQKEEEIKYLAYHDSLTGLPNRVSLKNKVDESIKRDPKQRMAMMFLDLDHFKLINDSLGHLYGDQLIQRVAKRLQSCLPFNGIVSRMGGDEFTVLITGLQEESKAKEVAQSILDALIPSFKIEDVEFHVTTSIGISFYPKDGEEYEVLLKKADTAMYQAKRKGKNMYHIFEPGLERGLLERLEIDASIRKALEHNELSLVYQPKFDLRTNKVSGMEALIRWTHPIYGLIPPDKFIPIIEENGLIIPVGEWVLREACRQNKAWQDQGYNALRMAVNLSVKQLLHPRFLFMINQVLEDTGLDPQWLELEITESTIMENAQGVVSILKAVKEKGINLSIDDFGTGYSSLSYLRQLPIHTIKVDRSFIKESSLNEESQMIIRAILSMARSLRLKVIAEGVEEEQQIEFLRSEGCDEIQGYIISRPLHSDEFITFLSKEPDLILTR